MIKTLLLATALPLSFTALAQDNTGSLTEVTQSDTSSSTTTDSTSSNSFDDASSPEMRAWEKSNEASTSPNKRNDSLIGAGRDNDDLDGDRTRSSERHSSRPTPEQVDGTYKVTASNGGFLCTVQLKASPYFDGYWAVTSTGCPELWKVSRWDFEGSNIVLTDSSGDVLASFRPRARDLWVGVASASGQRLSLSR